METEHLQTLPPPPGVVGSLKAGFDVIASNILVILLPLALDLWLWLGPHLRVDHLFKPFFDEMSRYSGLSGLPSAEVVRVQQAYAALSAELQTFNLMSVLRTFPIGVFSLMSGRMPGETPLGAATVIQVEDPLALLGWMALLTLAGWVSGGLFFRWVSLVVADPSKPTPFRFGYSVAQAILFSLLWIFLAFMIGIPVFVALALVVLASPLLAQAMLLIIGLLSMWLVVPVFFAPHGIFMRQENAFISIYTSLRMARFTLPTSSLFVLSVLLIAYGLNYLWNIPSSNSWMALVGITGHAFITTSLLAASFIFYRDMQVWLQTVFAKMKANTPPQSA
ncbi:MAG: hypothetical protein ACOYYJ_22030 [Chloroflexota bacterium]